MAEFKWLQTDRDASSYKEKKKKRVRRFNHTFHHSRSSPGRPRTPLPHCLPLRGSAVFERRGHHRCHVSSSPATTVDLHRDAHSFHYSNTAASFKLPAHIPPSVLQTPSPSHRTHLCSPAPPLLPRFSLKVLLCAPNPFAPEYRAFEICQCVPLLLGNLGWRPLVLPPRWPTPN
ncbi:hypothetical protein B0H19DRAFT_538954 [Mycena capillaripes]|nr:hypothetical protein B0H19DRAFT_538954 [Mycena capillaripes]